MKIGIVSDSHGKVRRLQAALDALAARGAQAVVHCGDVGGVECINALSGAGMDAYLVAGNMDGDIRRLQRAALAGGVKFSSEVIEVPLGDGRHLLAAHGHDEQVLGELIAGGQFPYVCCGHTHRFSDDRHRDVRVINPGALLHPKDTRRPTAALLDTETDTVERIDLEK